MVRRAPLFAAALAAGGLPSLTGTDRTDYTDEGDGPIGIEACAEIDESGEYELAADITSPKMIPSTDCILITADDVHLDGRGRTMVGKGASDTTAIYVKDATNVTVRNVELVGWHRAVLYHDVENGSIERVRAADNVFGVTFWGTRETTLLDGRISGNYFGVHASGDGRNRVARTRVAENHIDYDPEWLEDHYDR